MGRELKRVPMNFSHPLNQVWPGYVNPHYKPCPACTGGGGETRASTQLNHLCGLFAWAAYCAVAAKGERTFLGPSSPYHPMFESTGVDAPIDAALYEVINGLARRGSRLWNEAHKSEFPNAKEEGIRGLGSSDDYHIRLALLDAAGLPSTWGTCETCQGDGIDPTVKVAYESWTKADPPEGDGYQIWETVSEGSPISPVFQTVEEGVAWLITEGYSRKAAENFMRVGWVPSMVMTGTKVLTDIESATLLHGPGR